MPRRGQFLLFICLLLDERDLLFFARCENLAVPVGVVECLDGIVVAYIVGLLNSCHSLCLFFLGSNFAAGFFVFFGVYDLVMVR